MCWCFLRHTYSYNLKTGHTECVDGIKTFRFALYEGKIYYADEDNHGYVSIFDIGTGKIERTDEEVVFGFFIGEDGIKRGFKKIKKLKFRKR